MNRTILIVLGIVCAVITAAGSFIKTEPPAQAPTFEDWIKQIEHVGQYRDLTTLKNIPKDKIIVVRNDLCDENIKKAGKDFDRNYDHIQNVLTRLGIPHTLIGKLEFDKNTYSLNDKWAVLFNCNDFTPHCCNPDHALMEISADTNWSCPGKTPHMYHETYVSDKTYKKIRGFVEAGGYLFTEDRQIEEILERAFKGMITHTCFISGREFVISPFLDAHQFLKDVFNFPEQPLNSVKIKWNTTCTTSPNIVVLDKDVAVLIKTPQFEIKKEGERTIKYGAVAVTFSISDKTKKDSPTGKVLHTMVHFNDQASKTGEFALQNLLVNFLMEMAENKK